jgi:hypothetical protein
MMVSGKATTERIANAGGGAGAQGRRHGLRSPLSPLWQGGTENAPFPKGGRAQARGDLCQTLYQSRGV